MNQMKQILTLFGYDTSFFTCVDSKPQWICNPRGEGCPIYPLHLYTCNNIPGYILLDCCWVTVNKPHRLGLGFSIGYGPYTCRRDRPDYEHGECNMVQVEGQMTISGKDVPLSFMTRIKRSVFDTDEYRPGQFQCYVYDIKRTPSDPTSVLLYTDVKLSTRVGVGVDVDVKKVGTCIASDFAYYTRNTKNIGLSEVCNQLVLDWMGPETETQIAHLLPHLAELTVTILGPISFKFFAKLENLDALYINIPPDVTNDVLSTYFELDEEGYLVNMDRLNTLSFLYAPQLSNYHVPIRVDSVLDVGYITRGVNVGSNIVYNIK